MARRFGGPLVVALAAVALFAPGEASAQIPPQSWGSDYCADRSPNGQFTVPNNGMSQLNISFYPGSAPGSVQAEMYNTFATECLLTRPAVCPDVSCALQVQTVCEFHCGHNHTGPYGWTVQLWPTGATAGNFVGWPNTSCLPIKDAPQSYCIVRMPTTGALSAQPRFAAAPDSTPPTAPSASVSGVGSYAMTVSWSPSNDDYWLGGYDIFNGGTRLARVSAGTTSTRLESLSCATTYSIRVVAFDSRNSTSSNTVSARTGACVGSSDTRRPNTVFHVKPPRVTRSRTASFHFGANERARFRCKLDRRAWAKCRRSDPYRLAMGKTYRRLRPGYHTFRVRAIDRAGNRERSPAVYRWRIRR